LATLSPEVTGKQLELLKEIVTRLSLLAVIGNSKNPGSRHEFRQIELAAEALGMRLQYLDVRSAKDIESAFRAATKDRADALVVLGNPAINAHRKEVVDAAARSRLPASYARPEFVEAGGLMTYSVSYNDLFQRAAVFVDKILKGAKPADLPVEQPKKFELVINLRTANAIGVTIPPNVLARADRVIR
jgi:putative ABC transport system substrate-binding protein